MRYMMADRKRLAPESGDASSSLNVWHTNSDIHNYINEIKCDARAENIYILAYVHCLPSMVDLFQVLLQKYNLNPDNIIILPKVYSKIDYAIRLLTSMKLSVVNTSMCFKRGHYDESAWLAIADACKSMHDLVNSSSARNQRVILVDDGGLLTQWWHKLYPYDQIEVVSVQQTASGMWREPLTSRIPKINVANCAAKRHFESYIIARGIARKAEELRIAENVNKIGIAGYGAVGRAIANLYIKNGHEVDIHDKIFSETTETDRKAQYTANTVRFLKQNDVIFGCTGRNWCDPAICWNYAQGTTFISCSSRDVEYQSILQELGAAAEDECNPDIQYQDVRLLTKNQEKESIVKNGGFPINFDRNKEWEQRGEIVITRALVLAGIMQAMTMNIRGLYKQSIMLSPTMQKNIVEEWLKEKKCTNEREKQTIIEEFDVNYDEYKNKKWWVDASSGVFIG